MEYLILDGKLMYSPFYKNRKNPNYSPHHCFTTVKCEECGEHYEPCCQLKHICKKQNSYPVEEEILND